MTFSDEFILKKAGGLYPDLSPFNAINAFCVNLFSVLKYYYNNGNEKKSYPVFLELYKSAAAIREIMQNTPIIMKIDSTIKLIKTTGRKYEERMD